jgi:hypothetical protein
MTGSVAMPDRPAEAGRMSGDVMALDRPAAPAPEPAA